MHYSKRSKKKTRSEAIAFGRVYLICLVFAKVTNITWGNGNFLIRQPRMPLFGFRLNFLIHKVDLLKGNCNYCRRYFSIR